MTGAVVAVGSEADALTDKEPQGVRVIHPLRDGVIADLDATVVMLQAFLHQARFRRGLPQTEAVICLPVETTWVERRAVVAAAGALKPRCAVQLIDEPVAAAAGAGFDLTAGSGAFIVDVGRGTTEAAVLAGGYVVRTRTFRLGGNVMDDAIAVRCGRVRPAHRPERRPQPQDDPRDRGRRIADAETVGVDAVRRVPRVERVSARLVAGAIEPTVAAITSAVQEMLSDIPPNLAEEVVRGKIRLAGGGAMLPGLAWRIEAAADIPVVVVDDPLRCVIRGAALILEQGGVTEIAAA